MYDEREKDESKAKQWVVSARDVDDVEREMRVAERHRDGRRVSDRMRENRWRRSKQANVWARSCENDGIATKWTKIHIFCYKMLYTVQDEINNEARKILVQLPHNFLFIVITKWISEPNHCYCTVEMAETWICKCQESNNVKQHRIFCCLFVLESMKRR